MALDANGWTYGLPPGVKNEEGVHIVRICLIVMIGSTFFCFARFLARSVVIRRWAVDDTVLLFAWICAAAYGSMAIARKSQNLFPSEGGEAGTEVYLVYLLIFLPSLSCHWMEIDCNAGA